MKEELFQELLQSVREMKSIRSGKAKPSRTFTFDVPAEVAKVRDELGVSQPMFARLLGISEKTLQNWEQGRRTPSGPAKVLLKVAARHPQLLLEAAPQRGLAHRAFHSGASSSFRFSKMPAAWASSIST